MLPDEVTSKGRNECVIKIKGVNDRNASEGSLVVGYTCSPGSTGTARRTGGLRDDEFYSSELEGLEVVMQNGAYAKVVDVFRGAGTHDLLKVNVPPLPRQRERNPRNFSRKSTCLCRS